MSWLTCAIALGALARPGTVVMVHGAGGGGWEYDLWKPVFRSAGWRVVAPDLVPEKAGLAATTFADYARQVESWGARARRPLVLIGASMGGPLSLSAAAKLKPDAIVLVNSVAPAGIPVERKKSEFPDVVRWANGPIQDTRDAMPDSDEKTIQWAWKRWRDESGAVMKSILDGVSVPTPVCPVMVVLGDKDTDVPNSVGLAMAKVYKADVEVFAGTSHVGPLMGHRAKEVAITVLRWIQGRVRKL